MKKGFTLIEILVAVAIFFTVVSIPTSFLILSLKSQRKVLGLREIIDNSSYALEYTSRILRMAKKDLAGNCITAGSNYENPNNDLSKIRFLNYQDPPLCQEFSLSSFQLGERKSTDDKQINLGSFFPLTSDNLEITLLKFKLLGEAQGDGLQPRATILFEIQKKGQPASKIRLQTTVSQRNLDVTY